MSKVTARCYTCHALRPVSDFKFRRKDNDLSATARLKRYVGVLFQRPGATKKDDLRTAGAIYRYRCVDPRSGVCPKVGLGVAMERPQRVGRSLSHVEVRARDEHPLVVERRRQSAFVERRVEVEIEVCEEQRPGFRQEKEDARKVLRQCVGMTEQDGVDR